MLAPLVVGVLGLAATIGIHHLLRVLDERVVSSQFQLDSRERQLAIEEEIQESLEALVTLSSLHTVYPEFTRADFHTFCDPILTGHPAIQALGWNKRVLAADRERHEASLRGAGFPDYEIKERQSQGKMVRAGDRDQHVVVTYLEPYEGNEQALGFDIASEEKRRAAVNRACETGSVSATAGITLVQERESQTGFLAVLPVYREGTPTSVAQRRSTLEGCMVGVFRLGEIVGAALSQFGSVEIDVLIFDDDAPPNSTALYDRAGLEASETSRLKLETSFLVGGRNWRILSLPTEDYLASHRTRAPLGALVVGLFITFLLVSYLTLLRRRAARIAELITEIEEKEEERLLLERQVLHKQKLESIGLLAGGIAHDFNNLLTGVMGNAELAQARLESTGTHLEELEQIQEAGHRASKLVHQMLAFAGKSSFVPTAIDLPRLLRGMTDLLHASLSKKADIQFRIDDGLDAVEGDPTQLRQVFMNLLLNASEALEDEPGTIVVRAHHVDVDSDQPAPAGNNLSPGTHVSVTVSDNGRGMDPDTLARVFDPFFTTKFQGRGLGLSAVQGIVRSHRGSIRVDSQPGHGTTFEVLLPTSRRPAVQPAPESDSTVTDSDSGFNALIVDDEERVRVVTAKLLSLAGNHTLEAVDGVHGLEVLREHHDAIDVVLLDLTMPRMNGRETLAEIQSVYPDLPVVLMSGYDAGASDQNLSGFAGFLRKPFPKHALLSTLSAAIQSRRTTAR